MIFYSPELIPIRGESRQNYKICYYLHQFRIDSQNFMILNHAYAKKKRLLYEKKKRKKRERLLRKILASIRENVSPSWKQSNIIWWTYRFFFSSTIGMAFETQKYSTFGLIGKSIFFGIYFIFYEHNDTHTSCWMAIGKSNAVDSPYFSFWSGRLYVIMASYIHIL